LSRFVAIVPLTKDITPASDSRQGNKSSRSNSHFGRQRWYGMIFDLEVRHSQNRDSAG